MVVEARKRRVQVVRRFAILVFDHFAVLNLNYNRIIAQNTESHEPDVAYNRTGTELDLSRNCKFVNGHLGSLLVEWPPGAGGNDHSPQLPRTPLGETEGFRELWFPLAAETYELRLVD
ncbi:hypothetical protein [Nisaea sp.]|uniref:hypothetical protein n=1 Tax=Nisaea sp. TaxID=2024842 RepID=UPI00326567CC